ncbi:MULTISPECIES: protein-L-isoaspartate(D-aspartate) O-methyltransferase [Marinobacter]|jgi:protein-L-isoaspartate(D-aspartate) O-methyltransferase|uniref:protein-L-isoaspartate(D-aspartate) O-methyltransferase n=1 Tax=Marinobacter TaxID=2742 RepID=UPI00200463D3|nr:MULTISPECIES: protein-L-isoaspartate(D-aspartate) O-methyltransferase [Marinobacter]MCK7550909.1 protein-L-isoaspartate(D-aspartate) O-methyltransferase [Marinobacter goseongensis]MDV3502846.1 protein-L-isoaspartate(D-aspartate) O-methyltransferase [Marinobacter sp. M-5]
MDAPDFTARRASMVDYQVRGRGQFSPAVLAAMRRVRREQFVPDELREQAYDDGPLPIGHGQTVSQPYIVALMAEALSMQGGEKVLDIGTGSGYGAAVLACIAGEVFGIERLPQLAQQACRVLLAEGFLNVHVRCGDGTLGWQEVAPFDGIVVAAGGPGIPETLKNQLVIGGRLVMPVGSEFGGQELVLITRVSRSGFERESLGEVRFVPLLGAEGWPAENR